MLVSASPHLHCGETTRIVMQDVVIALLPALVVSFIYYGWRALMLTAVCVLSCVLAEYFSRRVMKRTQTISDFSAVVTGILLAFCLPAEINPLFAVFGSIVAIVVVKQMFGGIGSNFANPAATARIVLMLSFPAAMTTFSQPFGWMGSSLDTVSSATPLVDPESYSAIDLLLGVHGGSMGETCSIALLLGGAYLMLRKVISWHIPVTFIATAAVLSLVFGLDPVAQICSGGLLLGAFFMATDYVTSPVNKRGQLVFGIGCGLLTMLIRRFGAMAEGVSFAILLMNILTPHIERLTTPRPFGEEGEQA
ncbi:MAG: RnfABCDGE type electron transport complex subunit D [Ruminococcaceae bacterium]|nr:RnfABCDGE type electron transport complex subunit D [Oscillospiraceae bacterium]